MNLVKNRKVILACLLLLLLAAAIFGWRSYQASAKINPEENSSEAKHLSADTLRFATDAPQLLFLNIQPVEVYPEPLVEALNARISYDDNHTARVFTPLAGRVTAITAEAGQQVKTGAPLLVLDSPDFAMAEADNEKARADQIRKKIAIDRAKQLYEIKGIALKDVEMAEADWQQAEAEAQRTRAHLQNLNADDKNTPGKFVLRAPISGIISERQVSAGSEVRPDATNPLFVITDPHHLWVLVDLPERQLDKVKIGRAVSIEVDAYPGTTFTGKISVISGALDPVTRRIQVRCEVENPALKLKPEMFARVTPIANRQSKLPRVPNAALVTQGLYSFIFVEQSPGVLQRRQVVLDMQGSQYTYIKNGLHAGERVVTSGALLLNSELSGSE
jgi:cobalt-zinc-cadmium efflux system membrane fusion protein